MRRGAWVLDLLWPRLTGAPQEPPSKEFPLNARDQPMVEAIERAVERRLGRADDRLRTLEAKLAAQLTLTSFLLAPVSAGFVAVSSTFLPHGWRRPIWCFLLGVLCYLVAQLVCSFRATLSALHRREYYELSHDYIIPSDDEDDLTYRTRILSQHLKNLHRNEHAVDQIVSQMAVAHLALRNALVATIAMIPLGLTVLSRR